MPNLRGTVHIIEPTKTFGQKGFQKRTVVLEQMNGRHSEFIPIEFQKDDCDSCDELHLGDEIDVTYHLTGRKWQKDPQSEVKVFLTALGVSFRVISQGQPDADYEVQDNQAQPVDAYPDDDLPF